MTRLIVLALLFAQLSATSPPVPPAPAMASPAPAPAPLPEPDDKVYAVVHLPPPGRVVGQLFTTDDTSDAAKDRRGFLIEDPAGGPPRLAYGRTLWCSRATPACWLQPDTRHGI